MFVVENGPLLVLARHGQSEGNKQNIFTGWRDLPLTAQGETEAVASGIRLADKKIQFHRAFTSMLARASMSCALMLAAMKQDAVPITASSALNERNYGDLTGLNKEEARQRFGAEQVKAWRRSYEVSPPNGESLRDTLARVVPFYVSHILPAVMRSGAVLVVAHGNSLRALILALEGLSPDAVTQVELGTGEIRLYSLRPDTTLVAHSIEAV